MTKRIVGYTSGVFDMFHVGHLNILRNAKSLCDILIVAVSTDEIAAYKGAECCIPYEHRVEIVRSIKFVDLVVPQINMDKIASWEKLKFDIMFVGDDWYNTDKWNNIEKELKNHGVPVIYFPYTQGISSTKLRNKNQ